MKNTPKTDNFERLVVVPIENGYLAQIEREDEDKTKFFRSLKRATDYLATANTQDEGEQE